jgi:hypothetical protein
MPRVALYGLNLAPGMAPRGCSRRSNSFSELETSSRLGLTWANGGWLEGCPQVKRAWPTFSGTCGSGLAGFTAPGRCPP